MLSTRCMPKKSMTAENHSICIICARKNKTGSTMANEQTTIRRKFTSCCMRMMQKLITATFVYKVMYMRSPLDLELSILRYT